MKLLLKSKIVLIILLPIFLQCQNTSEIIESSEIEVVSKINYNPYSKPYFDNLNWKPKLSQTDKASILVAIDSFGNHHQEMFSGIIVPAIVHRMNSITNEKNLLRFEPYRHYFKESKGMTNKAYDEYLFRQIDLQKLRKFNMKFSHYSSIDDELLNALVFRQAQLMRIQKTPTVKIKDSYLNGTQKEILEYSNFSNSEAITKLIERISKLDMLLTNKEYALLETLKTYGKEATEKIFNIVLDTNKVEKISDRGRLFMVLLLSQKSKIDLSKANQEKLVAHLNDEDIYKGVFANQVSEIAFLTNRITGEDLEVCHNRVGVFYNKEAKERMMKRIQEQMEKNREERMKKNKN